MSGDYIQKVLAQAGYGSRREIEARLCAGRIRVNGHIAEPGQCVGPHDRLEMDGKPLRLPNKLKRRLIALYKPEGLICTHSDPEGRDNVYTLLPPCGRRHWISIGRLDINTSGLLLFSNDGDVVQRLAHPSMRLEREYAVRVLGEVSKAQLQAMRKGVRLDRRDARFTDIVYTGGKGANRWYSVTLTEGRRREVRRLWESQGLLVSRLIRVRFGCYRLPRGRRPGECWELDQSEIQQLLDEDSSGT